MDMCRQGDILSLISVKKLCVKLWIDFMETCSRLNKALKNPSFGLLPLLFFALIQHENNTGMALFVGLMLSLLGFFVVKRYSRLIYGVSTITFALTLLAFYLFSPELDNFKVFVFVDTIFVLLLMVMRLSRTKIIYFLARTRTAYIKNYLSESFRVAVQTQYGLSFHLLLMLAYYTFNLSKDFAPDLLMFKILVTSILGLIILIETIRLHLLGKKLFKEEWLPVVTEKGDVMGRIAKSVSKDMKNKLMHPVVRVALVYKGKIYLKKRSDSRLLNPGLLDYPFEKYMQFNHEIDEAVHNAVKRECGTDEIPLRFLLKYIFENEATKRLIFLYVSVIENETVFNKLQLSNGKLWTASQIEDNIDANIFSECFELEYDYLKNTVLLAHRLKQKQMAVHN